MSYIHMDWLMGAGVDVIKDRPISKLSKGPRVLAIQLAWHANQNTGQCNPSVQTLMDECGATEKTLYGWMKELEHAGIIERSPINDPKHGRVGTQYSFVHVVPSGKPFHFYRTVKNTGTPRIESDSTPRIESDSIPLPLMGGENKEEEEQGIRTRICGFETFYRAYPRHKARGSAERAFKTAIKSASLDDLMDGVRRYKAEIRAQGTQPDKIAYPATWLNAKRWLDEPDIPRTAPKKKKWPMA